MIKNKVQLLFLKYLKIFLITFGIVLLLCSSFSVFIYFSPLNLASESKIKLNNTYLGSENEDIYSFFPDLATKLWIFSSGNQIIWMADLINNTIQEIKSREILNETLKKLNASGYFFEANELGDKIDVSQVEEEKILSIKVYSKSAEESLLANKVLINSYIDYKNQEFEDSYNELLNNVKSKISYFEESIDNLSKDMAMKNIALKTEEAKKNNQQDKNMIISINANILKINREMNNIDKPLNFLKKLKMNLIENKEIFLQKLEIIEEPEIINKPTIKDLSKDIIFSLIIALFSGFVGIFIANYCYKK